MSHDATEAGLLALDAQFDSVFGANRRPKIGFEVVAALARYPVLCKPSPSSGPGNPGENRFFGRVVGKWLCEMTSVFIIKSYEERGL